MLRQQQGLLHCAQIVLRKEPGLLPSGKGLLRCKDALVLCRQVQSLRRGEALLCEGVRLLSGKESGVLRRRYVRCGQGVQCKCQGMLSGRSEVLRCGETLLLEVLC